MSIYKDTHVRSCKLEFMVKLNKLKIFLKLLRYTQYVYYLGGKGLRMVSVFFW